MLYIIFIFPVGTYCSELHKMVYLQNRKFLPEECALRQDEINFPTEAPETCQAPAKKVYETVKDAHKAYDAAQMK